MRDRMNVYLPSDLMKGISELAERKKLSRSAIVEAAVASFLSPDGADKREAAFAVASTGYHDRRRGWNAISASPPKL